MSDPSRSEKKDGGVSLQSIDPFVSAKDRDAELDLTRSVSLQKNEILDAYTRDALVVELDKLNSELQECDRIVFERGEKKNKPVLAEKVICARKKLILLDMDWINNQRCKIQAELDERKEREKNQFK